MFDPQDEELREFLGRELVGLTEIATIFQEKTNAKHSTIQRIDEITRSRFFPAPLPTNLSRGRLWYRSQVENFISIDKEQLARSYKSERAALLATVKHKRLGLGRWLIEGTIVEPRRNYRTWVTYLPETPDEVTHHVTFVKAIQHIIDSQKRDEG